LIAYKLFHEYVPQMTTNKQWKRSMSKNALHAATESIS